MNSHSKSCIFFSMMMMTIVGGCAPGADDDDGEDVENIADNDTRVVSFEKFLSTVHQDSTGKYVYDGDAPAHNMASLHLAWEQMYPQIGALTVAKYSGVQDDIWRNGEQLNLTYCISNGFGANKQAVINAMNAAGAAWSAQALVKFIYVPAQDTNCTSSNTNVIFTVNSVSGTSYLAAAFYPSWPRASRTLNVDNSAYSSGFSLAGMMMHELGHVLGFRHEFFRAASPCSPADGPWRGVTPYDTGSIMDYPGVACGGTNPFSNLDQNDIEGATMLYGSRVWAAPIQAPGCGKILGGKGLAPGQFIASCDNSHLLAHSTDGSLVLYNVSTPDWKVTWTSGTAGQAGYGTYMQPDGNLVIYTGLTRALWHTGTWNNPGSSLAVQNDGNLVIYSPQGQALWNSGTWGQ